jgi:hypothetical protein
MRTHRLVACEFYFQEEELAAAAFLPINESYHTGSKPLITYRKVSPSSKMYDRIRHIGVEEEVMYANIYNWCTARKPILVCPDPWKKILYLREFFGPKSVELMLDDWTFDLTTAYNSIKYSREYARKEYAPFPGGSWLDICDKHPYLLTQQTNMPEMKAYSYMRALEWIVKSGHTMNIFIPPDIPSARNLTTIKPA